MSKFRILLSESCIAAFYTMSGYFVKVYPALNIDKVKFSFVEKGKQGSGFDIYVDVEKFLLLTIDILSGAFFRRLAEDKGDFPQAWTYVTGENGAKNLAIGAGKKGIVIQGRVKNEDKSKAKSAFVPVGSYADLRTMAEMFQIVTGYKPVTGYFATLKSVFEAGVANMAKFYTYNSHDDEPAQEQQAETPAPVVTHTEAQTPAATAADAPNGQVKSFGVFTGTSCEEFKNGLYIKAVNAQSEEDHMIILSDRATATKVLKLKKAINAKPTKFAANYVIKDGKKYFLSFPA